MTDSPNQKTHHFVTAVHAGLKASEIALKQAEKTNALFFEHGQRHADRMHGHYAALAEIHDPGHFLQHMYEHVADGFTHAVDAAKDFFALGQEFQNHYAALADVQLKANPQPFGGYVGPAVKDVSSKAKVPAKAVKPRITATRTRPHARKR